MRCLSLFGGNQANLEKALGCVGIEDKGDKHDRWSEIVEGVKKLHGEMEAFQGDSSQEAEPLCQRIKDFAKSVLDYYIHKAGAPWEKMLGAPGSGLQAVERQGVEPEPEPEPEPEEAELEPKQVGFSFDESLLAQPHLLSFWEHQKQYMQ